MKKINNVLALTLIPTIILGMLIFPVGSSSIVSADYGEPEYNSTEIRDIYLYNDDNIVIGFFNNSNYQDIYTTTTVLNNITINAINGKFIWETEEYIETHTRIQLSIENPNGEITNYGTQTPNNPWNPWSLMFYFDDLDYNLNTNGKFIIHLEYQLYEE